MPELQAHPEDQETSLTERRRAAGRIKDVDAAFDRLAEGESGWQVSEKKVKIELDPHQDEKEKIKRIARRDLRLEDGTFQRERFEITPIIEGSLAANENSGIGSEVTYHRSVYRSDDGGGLEAQFISGEYAVIDMAGGITSGPLKPHPFSAGLYESGHDQALEPTDPRAADEFQRIIGRLQPEAE